MNSEQRVKLSYLKHCTFLPGSWQKRFVRDMATKPEDYEATARQAYYIDRLYYNFRRQIRAMGGGKPAFIHPNDPPPPVLEGDA